MGLRAVERKKRGENKKEKQLKEHVAREVKRGTERVRRSGHYIAVKPPWFQASHCSLTE
jgi:hypothetical protein